MQVGLRIDQIFGVLVVLRQPFAKRIRRFRAVSRQLDHPQPKPRAYRNVRGKGGGPKLSVAGDEPFHRRHFKIGFIRDDLEPDEGDVVGLGGTSHGRGFHVDRVRPVSFRQLGFLLDARGLIDTDQDPVPDASFDAASVLGVDDANWSQNRAYLQGGIQGPGKPGGLHQNRCIQIDNGLGRPAGGFRADAAADEHGAIVLEKSVLSAIVVALDRAPLLDERAHLALEGGYYGDFGLVGQFKTLPSVARPDRVLRLRSGQAPTRSHTARGDAETMHNHWPGTTRLRGATRRLPGQSSIPNHVRLCSTSQTSFSGPCGPRQWWREVHDSEYNL